MRKDLVLIVELNDVDALGNSSQESNRVPIAVVVLTMILVLTIGVLVVFLRRGRNDVRNTIF